MLYTTRILTCRTRTDPEHRLRMRRVLSPFSSSKFQRGTTFTFSTCASADEALKCWWDQWILDVLVCNWIGIYAGMKVCQYFEVKHYEWRSVAQTPGFKGKTKRVLGQFSPYNFTTFHWGGTKNFKSYCIVLLLLAVFLLAELNPFYLKYLLWMEASHPFVITRVSGVFLCGLPAARELYVYMNDPRYVFSLVPCFFCVRGLIHVSLQPLCSNGPTCMAHDRNDRDRGSHHRQMGRFPSAMPEKRQVLLEHGRGLPCCVPDG